MGAKQSHEAREALRMIREGKSVQEAAAKAGVHESTVWRIIKSAGIAYVKPKRVK